ncbi:MAG: C25 family cysteine peptidase [Bacteroidota bacterium]
MKRFLLYTLFIFYSFQGIAQATYGNEWIQYNQTYYSFKIIKTGITKINYSTLDSAGIPLSSISHQNLQIFGREKEQALFVELGSDGIFNSGDFVAFYAEKNDGWLDQTLYTNPTDQGNPKFSLYNDTIQYFVTWNTSTNNLRFSIETDTDFNSYTPATHLLCETSQFYAFAYNEGEKNSETSSSFYTPGEGWGNSMVNGAANYTLNLSAVTSGLYSGVDAPTARFETVSVSNSNANFTGIGNHHLKFSIGSSDFPLIDSIFIGYKAIHVSKTFPTSELANNSTGMKWQIVGDQGATTDFQSLNYWSIWYPRIPDFANNNQLTFNLKNNSTETKIRLDVSSVNTTDPFVFVLGSTPRKVPFVQNGGIFQALIPNDPVNQEQKVVFQDASLLNSVYGLTLVNGTGTFTNFATTIPDSAILMVYHPSLENGVVAYKTYRESPEGGAHGVIKANVNELYLQFGGGIEKHINGIRRFAHYMYASSTEKPQALFLIGKGIREANISGITVVGPGTRLNATNFAKSLVPSFGQPSSDAFITARLEGASEWMPLIPTGRVSVETNQQLLNYLDKVVLYDLAQDPNSVYNSVVKDWQKQVLHFVGGSDANQQQIFQNYMLFMENIIEQQNFGGNVFTLAKNNADPLNPSDLDDVMTRISNGVSIINYFGHAAATETGFEINIDNPNLWNNYGKYPIVFSNSCYNGNLFQNSESKSEEFVRQDDYGAIAFVGTVNLGFANTLYLYTRELYNQISFAQYGNTLAEQMQETIRQMEILSNNLFMESTAAQMVLNGDPMIRPNWHRNPEIEITEQSVSFLPESIDLTTDSIEINIELTNLGKSITDTFSLEVTRNFPSSNVDSVYIFAIEGLHYKKTHTFKVPLEASVGLGINNFDVKVDLPSFVGEQYDEINNNQITKTLFINIAGIEPVIPFDFAVVPIDSVTVKASTIDPIAPFNTYRFEMDTTDLYNSPFKKYALVSGLGGVKEVHPSQWLSQSTNMPSPLVCVDSMVYFWRVAIDQDTNWREHSFQHIIGKEGWGQDHFFQYKKNTFNDLDYDRAQRQKNFLPESHIITNDVKANLVVPDIYYNAYFIDGTQKEYSICTTIPSIHVAVIDPLTTTPWGTRFGTSNPTHNFGNANDNGACRNRVERYFIFRQNDPAQLANFTNMVLNEVPDGHYILIYTPVTARYDMWDANDPSIYATFAALGSDSIYAGRPNRPFSFFVRKGDPSTVKEEVGQLLGENITLIANMDGADYQGGESSTLIGPAASWDAIFWKQDAMEVNSNDTTLLRIEGLSLDLTPVFDTTITFTNNDSLLNISTILDPYLHPYMRMHAYYKDSITFTPAQMDYWHVLYQPLPEAAIDGSTPYSWITASDTISEGEMVKFAVDVKNIFTIPMDSILINYWVTDQNQQYHSIAYPRQDSLLVNETFRDTVEFSTTGMGGINSFWMEINPYVNGSLFVTDQPEQKHFNNLLQIPFFVKEDNLNPILDVTFDGIHILNNDIVSPESEIIITLKDENPFLVLNSDADTSLFGIYVKDPDGILTHIPFVDGAGNTVMQWIPAESQFKKFKIIYPAIFQKEGKYTLLVQGSDKSGNLSGDIEYRIEFQVIHASTITEMMNYPNPFSTSTRFVFTLTGSETPDDILIQIMTVSGRVVREISESELGPIHIGRNITEFAWDGRDQFGDPLANGVYLYHVKAKINGEDIERLNSGADTHFKKGFGKMYLMR